MSTRRLFFALWPDAAMREALWTATRPAVGAACGGRPVPLGNLHVTLAFLGTVPESSLAALRDLARIASAADGPPTASLSVTLDALAYWRRSRILCATASCASEAALALAERLGRLLADGGFRPDLEPFRAHVTLARHVRGAPPDLRMPAVTWRFTGFALIESRTLPEGSAYSIVDSWVLNGVGDAAARPAPAREKTLKK